MPNSVPKSRLEIAARALCRYDSHPEDIKFEGKPMWESYTAPAQAVLDALDAMRPKLRIVRDEKA